MVSLKAVFGKSAQLASFVSTCCSVYTTKVVLWCSWQGLFSDLDYESNSWFVCYMITTFYASVYMFSNMLSRKMDKMFKYSPRLITSTALFVVVSCEIIKMMSEFGMVFPIAMDMEKTMESLFNLLVPHEDLVDSDGVETSDLQLYTNIRWPKSSDATVGEKIGWSNFPIMMWVVGLLIEKGFVKLEDRSKNFVKRKPSNLIEDYTPWVIVGDKSHSLYDFIMLVLFEVWDDLKNDAETLQL